MKIKNLDAAKFIICKATLDDCKSIQKIINSHARSGAMLKKSMAYLKTHISDYFVAKINGTVIGVCGIKIWPSGLVEIVSSAVHGEYHGKGAGGKLNRACIAYARSLGFDRIFVLTNEKRVSFYAHLGFVKISKAKLSAKIFTDCRDCKFNRSKKLGKVLCGDIAMRYIIP